MKILVDPTITIQISLVIGMIGLFFTIINQSKRIEDKVDEKIEKLESKMDKLESKLDKLKDGVGEMKLQINSIESQIERIEEQNKFLTNEVLLIKSHFFVPRFPRQEIRDNTEAA